VVLALGAGWLLRGGQDAATTPADAAVDAQARVETADGPPPVAPEVSLPEDRVTEVATRESSASSDGALLPSQTERLVVAVEADPTPAPEVVTDIVAGAPPLPEAPRLEAGPDRPVPSDEALTPDLVVDLSGSADGATAQRERRTTSPDVVTSANIAAPPLGIATFGRPADFGAPADRDEEEDEESYSLVVPDIEVLDVRFRGTGVRPEGQVVLQRLASGDTLRVIHLPPEIDLSSIEELASGRRQLVVQTSTGLIVMRAPVGEEALRELMGRLLTEN
jgi:hypothetical protein